METALAADQEGTADQGQPDDRDRRGRTSPHRATASATLASGQGLSRSTSRPEHDGVGHGEMA